MATCRRFLNLTKINKNVIYSSYRCCSTSVEVKQEPCKTEDIVIPYRIHRGPTDILKALSSTISKDYTAAPYKYEDDPYFMPASNITKRSFALSKEAGRKAARYFLEKYPQLFVCNESVPHIKAFHPPPVYTQENVTSPNVLIECIKNIEVTNSIAVYKILKEKGITVSQEVKQNLLELLCFYNGSQPLEEDYYEERFFQRDHFGERWNLKGEAERLFDEMEKDANAYSALIAGAGKFQDSERAYQLYAEMSGKDLIPTVVAYNSLISLIPAMKERRDSGCENALIFLNNMKKDGLIPNLHTMNAVLDVFMKRRFKKSGEFSLSLLTEMKNLNIEPSLGTYSLILNIFCNDDRCQIGALYEIVSKIEGKEFTCRHPLDVSFFRNAMEKCFKYAHDKELAYRINKVVEYRNNSKLLGNSMSESMYFKCFFRLLSDLEDFQQFMEIYEQYVPNTYTPEPLLMLDILHNLQLSGLHNHLPKICNDVYLFEQTERENVLSLVFDAAGSMKYDTEIQQQLVEIIWKMVDKLNTRIEGGRFNFVWTGTDLGNALSTFVNGEDLEKSWFVMEQIGSRESKVIGPPKKEALLSFCEFCLIQKDYDKVKFCIKYATREAFPDFRKDFKRLSDNMFVKQQIEEKNRVHVNDILRLFSFDISNESSNDLSSTSSSSDLSSDSSSSDSSSSDEDESK